VAFRAVVVANTHLVRQLIVPCLLPLGGQVREFAQLADLVARINALAPDLLVIDTDGISREWRALAGAIHTSARPIPLVLLASRFGFGDAHDAFALGVSSVILKPYRREEHTARLYDLVLKHRGIRARRSEPRLVLAAELSPRVDFEDRHGPGSAAVVDLSHAGIGVSIVPDGGDRMELGSFIANAAIVAGEVRASLTAQVVYRGHERAGLQVRSWDEGKPRLARLIDETSARAFGPRRGKRKW
jgi:CheY-like chemotaxis protein